MGRKSFWRCGRGGIRSISGMTFFCTRSSQEFTTAKTLNVVKSNIRVTIAGSQRLIKSNPRLIGAEFRAVYREPAFRLIFFSVQNEPGGVGRASWSSQI